MILAPRTAAKWSQERRLEFIEYRLRWDGRLNRSDLIDFFGISTPQASLDIARYSEIVPGNLVYDRSERVYLPGEAFKPVFKTSHPAKYLNDLLARVVGLIQEEPNSFSWYPPVDIVSVPVRTIPAEILCALVKAIREKKALQVIYQSMSRPEPSQRLLTPHALAHDGFRWHVRAYCHSRHRFRDFVIARMLSVKGNDASTVSAEDDREWQTLVRLVLAPHPGLTEAHRRVIELDYGMDNGEVVLKCRQALLFYLLKHLRLEGESGFPPEAQQIVLKNAEEVARYTSLVTSE